MAKTSANWFFRALRRTPKENIYPKKRGWALTGGVEVNEDSSMQVSAFYRGVIYISSQIAKLPWQVKDAQNNIIDNNISYLLDLSPNPEMSSMAFKLLGTQTAIVNGNFYAEIERDSLGRPVAMWPIPSNNVEVLRVERTAELIYRVMGGSLFEPGRDVYMRPQDMFHLKNFHMTKDGLMGQGVVAYAKDSLGISLGADRMAGNLFANGGMPSGTLEVPGTLSDEAFERVKASWKENHGGRKSGGVAILEEGMKFNSVSMNPDVMQFLESRKFSVLEVARFLGLPPTKLFDTEASTFNNQENSNLEVATDTLDAWAKNWEIEADIKILNRRYGGRRSEMDLYAVFRGDMETRANYFSKMMQVASITPNEIRTREGMAPYAEGDRFFVSTNNYTPADRLDEVIDKQVMSQESAPTQQQDRDDEDSEEESELSPEERDALQAATEFLRRK
jgi:HK97 family phage portal protein